jgi:hypothetical protein
MDDPYKEVFEIEVEGWCDGITNYSGEISYPLVFSVIRELSPSFKRAIEKGIEVDVVDIAGRLCKAAKYLVDEQRIAFDILCEFPNPLLQDEQTKSFVDMLIERLEETYPGARDYAETRWTYESVRASEESGEE